MFFGMNAQMRASPCVRLTSPYGRDAAASTAAAAAVCCSMTVYIYTYIYYIIVNRLDSSLRNYDFLQES